MPVLLSCMQARTFFLLLSALFCGGMGAYAQKVPAEALGTFQYDVRYKLRAMDTKVATATISFEKGSWEEQAAYHAYAIIRTTPIFHLFLGSDYSADAYLSTADLSPFKMLSPLKKGRFECSYDREARTVRSFTQKGNTPPVEAEFPLDGRTLDLLSLIQHVRFLKAPAPGRPLSFKLLAVGGEALSATLDYQGTDTERFPGENAERFLLKLTEHGLMDNGSGDRFILWRSTGPDRRLLGLETELSTGTMYISIR